MTKYLDFLIPSLRMTRGQAVAIQADLEKQRCYLCEKHDKCTVMSHGHACEFKPNLEARKVRSYLLKTRGV